MTLPVAEEKAFSTLQARGAMVGVTVHQLEGDDGRPEYVVTRWALTQAFRTLDDLAAWLDRIGAPR